MKQARLAVWDPVLEDWYTRFRGFVESYEYDFDPSQLVNRVTIKLVDIFEIVSAIQMFPGFFGYECPPEHARPTSSTIDTARRRRHTGCRRCVAILSGNVDTLTGGNCGIHSSWYDIFSGNVSLHAVIYSPGESAMAAIQEAVDAEFPGVGNFYCDRLGRLAIHGRYARFDPVGPRPRPAGTSTTGTPATERRSQLRRPIRPRSGRSP